jgi:hypothetical protein
MIESASLNLIIHEFAHDIGEGVGQWEVCPICMSFLLVFCLSERIAMTIDQVFEMILADPYMWGKTGMSEDRRHYFRHWHRKKKNVSVGKKLEIIQAVGIEVKMVFLKK